MYKLIRNAYKFGRLEKPFVVICNSTRFAKSSVVTEDDIFEALSPKRAPKYEDKDYFINLDPVPEKNVVPPKQREVIITCKNSSLNHLKNQTYDKLSPVPLASKGWKHRLSKGDFFTIKICNDEDYIDSLFWDNGITNFSCCGLKPNLIEALESIGISKPTKIQVPSIESLLSGKNTLLTAETGCGKTLAYLIPVIEQILHWKEYLPVERNPNSPLVLIIVPSRDLAVQIGEIARKLSFLLPFRCNTLIGGRTKKKMLNPNFAQVDLQIASLGALSKLTTVGIYNLSEVKHVVLDEGDTLLDDSFNETLVRILRKIKIRYGPTPGQKVPDNSQLTIVSATIPTSIYQILENIVEPDSLNKVTTERVHKVLPHVPQTFYRLGHSQKPVKLMHLVKEGVNKNESIMIFSKNSKTSDWISLFLNENGIQTEHLNAKIPEDLRKTTFNEFKEGKHLVLSCTDIASRGLDTVNVRRIINYDFPFYMADYIHRCGRTGRVGSHSHCHVYNFISTFPEIDIVNKIEMAVRMMDTLPNVNANISKIIKYKILKSENT